MKQTRTIFTVLMVGLAAILVSDVMAQGRGGRGGGPGGRGGGPGGFGGGPGGFGGPGGPQMDPTLGLLQIPEVRAELDLFPDQEAALAKLNEQQGQAVRGGGGIDFRGLRDASEEERQEAFRKMAEQRQEAEKKLREQLEQVLLPDQMERLEQIGIQAQGLRVLQTEKVAEALKITDAQKQKFDEVRESMGRKMREAFQGENRENMRQIMQDMQAESDKEILAVLTPEQKSKFEEMKGEPFDMPQRGAFGRGGPGFGGAGGGGPPGGGRFGGRGGDRGGQDGGRRRGGGRPDSDN